jgi:hypothetical protein
VSGIGLHKKAHFLFFFGFLEAYVGLHACILWHFRTRYTKKADC